MDTFKASKLLHKAVCDEAYNHSSTKTYRISCRYLTRNGINKHVHRIQWRVSNANTNISPLLVCFHIQTNKYTKAETFQATKFPCLRQPPTRRQLIIYHSNKETDMTSPSGGKLIKNCIGFRDK